MRIQKTVKHAKTEPFAKDVNIFHPIEKSLNILIYFHIENVASEERIFSHRERRQQNWLDVVTVYI